jgi:hypothetical protein
MGKKKSNARVKKAEPAASRRKERIKAGEKHVVAYFARVQRERERAEVTIRFFFQFAIAIRARTTIEKENEKECARAFLLT